MPRRRADKLGPGGQALWDGILEINPDLNAGERVILLEACRNKDRLDLLNHVITGRDLPELVRLFLDEDGSTADERQIVVRVDGVLSETRQLQNVTKQLVVTLRLPDSNNGARPARRTQRGAYGVRSVPDGGADDESTGVGALRGILGGKSA